MYLRMLGKGLQQNYHPVSVLFMLSIVFEKLANNSIVDHLEKCGLFSDFEYGLGLQLQILLKLYLIEMLGILTGLGLLEL